MAKLDGIELEIIAVIGPVIDSMMVAQLPSHTGEVTANILNASYDDTSAVCVMANV